MQQAETNSKNGHDWNIIQKNENDPKSQQANFKQNYVYLAILKNLRIEQ